MTLPTGHILVKSRKGKYTPIPPLQRAFLENPQPLTWPKETP